MLARNYYDRVSPEGIGPEDRIRAAGYPAGVSGESMGILGYLNFMPPEEAVERIFESMFRDELSPERSAPRWMLSPDVREMGIGAGAGILDMGGQPFNVYLMVCDFGASAITPLEKQALALVNQIRRAPLEAAAQLGLSPDQVLNDLPDLAGILLNGLPPLTMSGRLYLASDAHARDMMENDYLSDTSEDGRTLNDRLLERGYFPLAAAEARRLLVSTDPVSPEAALAMQMERLLRRELSPDCEDRLLLNPEVREAGIRILWRGPDSWPAESEVSYREYDAHLMVLDAAASEEAIRYLSVSVFTDRDGNGRHDIGEEAVGVPVLIISENDEMHTETDESGVATLALREGEYWVSVPPHDEMTSAAAHVYGANAGVVFRLTPP